MTKCANSRNVSVWLTLFALGATALGFTGQKDAHNRSQPSRDQRPQQNRTVQPVHARRETVRTPNFVKAPTHGPIQSDRPTSQSGRIPGGPVTKEGRVPRVSSTAAAGSQRRFTKTTAGRVYDNGLRLRKGIQVSAGWERQYFPKGHYHFPYYRESYVRGQCFISPFGFFFGVGVPFIGVNECRVYPPSVAFVDVSIYDGVTFRGYNDQNDPNFLNDPNLDQEQPGLGHALDELTETFQGNNIDGLVSLVDPATSISVFLKGKYRYSIPSNDYVDLTRDEISSGRNVQFSLMYLHQRATGVFSASGRTTYRDQSGQIQTTWVSYVLQDISGQWTLTQIDTSPGIYRRLTR